MRDYFSHWRTIFWQKQTFYLLFVLVIVFAALFRLYKLGQIPAGFSWDEAAIGYNGSAIWETRRDEWLIRLPVSFKSFGDFKAPLAIYINGLFTTILGMQVWVVRLPFALAGIFTVMVVMLVVYEVFRKIPHRIEIPEIKKFSIAEVIALMAGVMIATSPWHIHFSRAGFESGMALAFTVFSVYAWFVSQRKEIREKPIFSIGLLILAGMSGSFAAYTYHSAKIAVPLLYGVMFLTSRVRLRRRIIAFVILCASFVLVSFPLIQDMIYAKGAERFNQTSLFSEYPPVLVPFVIAENLLAHSSIKFLLLGQTTTLRHGDGKWGVLFVSEWILIITMGLGLLYLCRKSIHSKQIKEVVRVFLFGLGWIVSGLVPAAIGLEIPHSNRALLSYPGFIILSSLGIFFILHIWSLILKNIVFSSWVGRQNIKDADKLLILKSFVGTLFLIHVFVFLSYWKDYRTEYAVSSADSFQYGYEEAFKYVIPQEDLVEKILFTSKYGQPYIYALFFRQTNPIWYQGGSLIKYEFTDKINSGDLLRKNTILVADPDQIDPALGDSLILAPDGSVRFVLKKTTE